MPETKFTHGPYVVTGESSDYLHICGPDGNTVAALSYDSQEIRPQEENYANAHLLAAAPDLYIALLAIEEYILSEAQYAPNSFNGALRDSALLALGCARGEPEALAQHKALWEELKALDKQEATNA